MKDLCGVCKCWRDLPNSVGRPNELTSEGLGPKKSATKEGNIDMWKVYIVLLQLQAY